MQNPRNNRKRKRGCRAGRKVQECKRRRVEAIRQHLCDAQENPDSVAVCCAEEQQRIVEPTAPSVSEALINQESNSACYSPTGSPSPQLNTASRQEERQVETVDLTIDSDDEFGNIPTPPPFELIDTETVLKVRFHREIPHGVLSYAHNSNDEIPVEITDWCNFRFEYQ